MQTMVNLITYRYFLQFEVDWKVGFKYFELIAG